MQLRESSCDSEEAEEGSATSDSCTRCAAWCPCLAQNDIHFQNYFLGKDYRRRYCCAEELALNTVKALESLKERRLRRQGESYRVRKRGRKTTALLGEKMEMVFGMSIKVLQKKNLSHKKTGQKSMKLFDSGFEESPGCRFTRSGTLGRS
jgi:hypothetical protein